MSCPLSLGEGLRATNGESLTFDHFSGADQRPSRGRSAGVHFEWPKWTKSHLGRSPLRTSLWVRDWACVKTKFGPSPLLWPLFVPPHQDTLGNWPYHQVVSTSGPTLEKRRSRRREPVPRQLGTVAHQGKALAVEGRRNREVSANHRTANHLCDPTRLRAETRRTQGLPVPRGWIPQGGGRPRLWRFFPRFLRQKPAPQPGTLRWGNFLTGQKVTKDPPKAGPSPALWNPPCWYRVCLRSSPVGPWPGGVT